MRNLTLIFLLTFSYTASYCQTSKNDVFKSKIDPTTFIEASSEDEIILEPGKSANSNNPQSSDLSRVSFNNSDIYHNNSIDIIYLKNIELPVYIKIFDVSGNIMLGKILNTKKQVNIRNLDNGIYFLMIQNYGYTKTFKFTKE
jgi:Secretion system C-terminal sorting domain